MANYGIKIAEAGYDAKTAGLNHLIFHSSYPILKIKYSGSGSFTPDWVDTQTVYAHNLGYKPSFSFFTQYYDPSSGTKQTDYKKTTISDTLAGGFNMYTAYVDTTNLYFHVDLQVADLTALAYQYYIYYDPL